MLGTPGFNAHSPGPIGDVTPSTLAGTTLNLTSSAIQFTTGYDGSNYFTVAVSSNGACTINSVTSNVQDIVWQINGASIFEIAFNGATVKGNRAYNINDAVRTSTPRYLVAGGGGIADPTSTGGFQGVCYNGATYVANFEATSTLLNFLLPLITNTTSLPTSNPHVVGQLYSNVGIVTVSAG